MHPEDGTSLLKDEVPKETRDAARRRGAVCERGEPLPQAVAIDNTMITSAAILTTTSLVEKIGRCEPGNRSPGPVFRNVPRRTGRRLAFCRAAPGRPGPALAS